MFNTHRPRRRATLNIAPLLDMIFILLLFFVVSTTFSKMPGVMINRPDATVTDKLPPNNMLIGITKDGTYYINKNAYSTHDLVQKIRANYAANPQLSVVILADEESRLKYTVHVMDICKRIGISNIAIAEELVK